MKTKEITVKVAGKTFIGDAKITVSDNSYDFIKSAMEQKQEKVADINNWLLDPNKKDEWAVAQMQASAKFAGRKINPSDDNEERTRKTIALMREVSEFLTEPFLRDEILDRYKTWNNDVLRKLADLSLEIIAGIDCSPKQFAELVTEQILKLFHEHFPEYGGAQ